jgi:hypothetical protein
MQTLPPLTPSRANRFRWTAGGGFGSSFDDHTTVWADPSTAFDRAVAALRSEGGEMKWLSPPQNVHFTLIRKEGGVTLRYLGKLTVSALGRGRSMVRVGLRTDWGNVLPMVMGSVVMIFLLGWFLLPPLLLFTVPLLVLTAIYCIWAATSYYPDQVLEKVITKIGGASLVDDGTS